MSDSIYLEKHDDKQSSQHFYQLSVEVDLFGKWILTRKWGCVGESGGRMTTEQFETVEAARQRMNKQMQEKLKRGYKVS